MLTRDTDEIVLKGTKYISTQLPPIEAHCLLIKMLKHFLPAIATLKQTPLDKLMEMDVTALGPAVGAAFASMDADTVRALPREILAGTEAVVGEGNDKHLVSLGNTDGINLAFRGKGAALYAVMAFALKVNFSGFFDDLPVLMASLGLVVPAVETAVETEKQ